MTKVKCNMNECRYNRKNQCTRKLITIKLEGYTGEELPSCQEFKQAAG